MWCVLVYEAYDNGEGQQMVIGPFRSEERAEHVAGRVNEGSPLCASVMGMYAWDGDTKIDLVHWGRTKEGAPNG